MSWIDIVVVFAIFLISFFSVISGGIGLLSRPILILLGFPPEIAIGTFRVANLAGRLAGFSAIMHRHAVRMDWKLAGWLFIPSLLGGIAGAEIVKLLPADAIKKVLGAFILVMGLILLMKRELGLVERHEPTTKAKNTIGFIATVIIGIIAAFIGGSGILFGYMLIFVYNKSYLSSAPVRKIANFGSTLSSAIFFIIHGFVKWKLMILILIAGVLGEYFGGKYQIKKGEEWVRTITLIIVFASGLLMLFI
jgi:hypothetical protein